MLKEDTKIINSNKLYKLCKYYCRIKKSFFPLDTNKLANYLFHLKHHIYIGGSNTSQTDFEILNELVNELIKVIENNNNNFNNNVSLTAKLVSNLEQKLKDFDELNKLNKLNQTNQDKIKKKDETIEKLKHILIF
jgi:hypothetical protein